MNRHIGKILLSEDQLKPIREKISQKIHEIIMSNEQVLREISNEVSELIRDELFNELCKDRYSSIHVFDKLQIIINSLEENTTNYLEKIMHEHCGHCKK